MIKNQLIWLALLSASSVHGQESRAEVQSIRCAALFFVQTSQTAADPEFGMVMTNFTQTFSDVYSASKMIRTKINGTNGEVIARREVVLNELKQSWRSNLDGVVREAGLCTTWLLKFSSRLESMKDINSAAELVKTVGEPPISPSNEQVENWRPIIPDGFAAWANLGYTTPAGVRKMLEESVRRSVPTALPKGVTPLSATPQDDQRKTSDYSADGVRLPKGVRRIID